MSLRGLAAALLWMVVVVGGTQAVAAELDTPSGDVILTVRGNIARSNGPAGAQFDLAMLEKLPRKSITTTTRWTSGPQVFEGVPVTALLKHVGAQSDKIEAIALDGYAAPPMSVADLEKYGVILATKKNGEYLQVRDKGPLWMIYPVDDFPELQRNLLTQYKLIWHLRTLVVK